MTWAPNTADGLSPAPLLGALLSTRPLTRGGGGGWAVCRPVGCVCRWTRVLRPMTHTGALPGGLRLHQSLFPDGPPGTAGGRWHARLPSLRPAFSGVGTMATRLWHVVSGVGLLSAVERWLVFHESQLLGPPCVF